MAGALEIIQVVAEAIYVGQQVLNIYHALSPDSVPDSDVVDDLSEWLDTAYTEVVPYQDNNYQYSTLRILNRSDNAELGLVNWPTLISGSLSGQTGLPSGVAALITQPTTTLGVRGRKFIAGIGELYQDDSIWDAGFLGELEDMAAIISTPFIGGTSGSVWSPIVVSVALAPRVISGYAVTNVPAYQRRRRQGVGS